MKIFPKGLTKAFTFSPLTLFLFQTNLSRKHINACGQWTFHAFMFLFVFYVSTLNKVREKSIENMPAIWEKDTESEMRAKAIAVIVFTFFFIYFISSHSLRALFKNLFLFLSLHRRLIKKSDSKLKKRNRMTFIIKFKAINSLHLKSLFCIDFKIHKA